MITLFSIEFWIILQLFIAFLLVLLVWALVRKLRKVHAQSVIKEEHLQSILASMYQEIMEKLESSTDALADKAAVQMVDRAAQDIIDLLDPLVKGSESAANAFAGQIKEKQRLIRELNETLDSRIISINLLLSRAEVVLSNQDQLRMNTSGGGGGYRHSQSGRNLGFSGLDTLSDFKDRDLALRENAQQAQLTGEDNFLLPRHHIHFFTAGGDVPDTERSLGGQLKLNTVTCL